MSAVWACSNEKGLGTRMDKQWVIINLHPFSNTIVPCLHGTYPQQRTCPLSPWYLPPTTYLSPVSMVSTPNNVPVPCLHGIYPQQRTCPLSPWYLPPTTYLSPVSMVSTPNNVPVPCLHGIPINWLCLHLRISAFEEGAIGGENVRLDILFPFCKINGREGYWWMWHEDVRVQRRTERTFSLKGGHKTQEVTFESRNKSRGHDLVELHQHLWSRSEDGRQTLGRSTPHLPTDVIIITVLIIILPKRSHTSNACEGQSYNTLTY